MNIQDATKATTPEAPYITRLAWTLPTSEPCSAAIKVLPTNTPDCCIIESVFTKVPRRGWQPNAEDLMADDWIPASAF